MAATATVVAAADRLCLLLWAELRRGRGWPRALLAVAVIALGILGVGLLAAQAGRQQHALLATYQAQGAASFVVELAGAAPREPAGLSATLRTLPAVESVQAPLDGLQAGIVADTSFLVFHTGARQEYLGARTNVLGVGRDFQFGTDAYVNLHDLRPTAPDAVLPLPLLPQGRLRPPGSGELLVDRTVADYVGVRPGDRATIDLVYGQGRRQIVRTYGGLRVAGTFQTLGPDQGRVDPYYRLVVGGKRLLTVRNVGAPATPTTVPVLVNAALLADFQAHLRAVLAQRATIPPAPGRARLVVHAASLTGVPRVEQEVAAALEAGGLTPRRSGSGSGSGRAPSFRLLTPQRSNFGAALRQRATVAAGGRFFVGTLLLLLVVGTAGLQVQATLAQWRQYGILQALGFPRLAVARLHLGRLGLLLGAAVALAATLALTLTSISVAALGLAAALCVGAALLAGVPALLWPLLLPPADTLRVSA